LRILFKKSISNAVFASCEPDSRLFYIHRMLSGCCKICFAKLAESSDFAKRLRTRSRWKFIGHYPTRARTKVRVARGCDIDRELTLPTPVSSFTPILLRRAGGAGGGDLRRSAAYPLGKMGSSSDPMFSSPERRLRCGLDDRFNFCAALLTHKKRRHD